MFQNLLLGLNVVTNWNVLSAIVVGIILGYFVGAFPGLNPSTGVALLVPFTFGMTPLIALVMLCSLYTAAEYGGSITAILINTPGTAGAAATVLDGYPLAQKGFPGKALGTSIIASTAGGLIGTTFLIAFSVPLANFALRFSPAEYFSLSLFGLTIIATLSSNNWIKGFIAAGIGLLLKCIGTDPFASYDRFCFGNLWLFGGIPFIPAILGLFALTEFFSIVENFNPVQEKLKKFSTKMPDLEEILGLFRIISISSVIGTFIGMLPGAGGTVASFVAYNEAKRFSPQREEFGKGCLHGVAAPESANNAMVSGSLVPLLSLGIPGSATAAVLASALMIHGLQPGPLLFVQNKDIIYGLFVGLILGNFVMLALGLIGAKLWAKVVMVPRAVLAPLLFAICVIGAYSVNNSMFDVWIMIFFGVIGYVFRKFDFPIVPVIIALVLGYLTETSFRRALIFSNGSPLIFFTRPISLILIILAGVTFFAPYIREYKDNRKKINSG